MKSIKYFCFTLSLILIWGDAFAQEKNRDTGEWVRINENLINSVVTATDQNYNVTIGLLYGMKGDSIFIYAGGRIVPIDLNDLSILSLDYEKEGSPAAVIGMLSGVYLGSLLFYTSESGSAKYLEYDEGLAYAGVELLCLVVGGGVGYLIDISSRKGKKVFYFGKDGENWEKDIRNLKEFLEDHSYERKLHFNVYASYVNTRLSEINSRFGDYYPYMNITGLNLLRKLSLTYEVFDNLEFGIALCWLGEPDLNFYVYNYSYNYSSVTINQTYNGKSYYLLINYKPLKRIIPDNVDFVIGAGIGTGNVDYHSRSESITYDNTETISEIQEKKINKGMFSSMFSAEIRYYIYPVVNISLQADYIYLPEKMPAVPYLELKEKDLGGFALGFSFGFNF